MTSGAENEPKSFLFLDLGRIAFPLFLLLWFLAPYPRGLFFPSDALPFQVAFGCLLAIVALDELLRKGGRRWSRETWAALALPALYGLSFLFAVDKHQAIAESLKYLNYFAVLFIAARLASPSRLWWMAYTLLVSAAGVEMIGLLGALGLGRFPGVMISGSLQSTFGYQNALGGYLLAVFATGNALVSSCPGFVSTVIAGLNYLTTLSIVMTYSRGTWVLLPVMSIALVLVLPLSSRWKSLYAGTGSLSCAFLVLRGFMQAVGSQKTQTGLMWLIAGFGAAVLLEIGWTLVERLVAHRGGLEWRHRAVVVSLAVIWAITISASYFAYAFTAYPNFLAMLFPKQAITRAEAIKADEPSLLARLDCIRTASKIWARSPLVGLGGGAWNAFYHQYQGFLYWTTEVHSHYFQVLVEAGALGVIAFLAMWYFVVGRLVYAVSQAGDRDRALVMGTLVGAGMLAIHSAYDFDLSFPPNAYVVWGLLGAVGGIAYHLMGGSGSSRHKPRDHEWAQRPLRAVRLAIPFVVAAVLCVVPARLYRAGEAGAEAARWLSQNNFAAAERTYLEALEYDPYNAGFYIDLAHSQVGSYLVTGQASFKAKADAYLAESLRTGPYNIAVRLRVVDLYMVQERFVEAADAAEEVVKLIPLDTVVYEGLARCATTAAIRLAESGRWDEARLYAGKVLGVEDMIEGKSAGRDDRYPGPRVTAEIRMRIGQCHVVLGEIARAQQILQGVRSDKNFGDEATMWLGLTMLRSGKTDEGQKVLSPVLSRRKDLAQEANRIARLLQVNLPEVSR